MFFFNDKDGIFLRIVASSLSSRFPFILRSVQSTIERAHVLSDGVRERRAVLSTNKNMRALQETYQLIVDLADHALKIEEVLKRFVWMAEIEDHLQYDHVGLCL